MPVSLAQLSPMVTENGVPQVIESLSCPDDAAIRLSLAILLDRSRSMALFPNNFLDPDSTKLRAARKAISTFLGLLTPRDEAAIFSFTTTLTPPTPSVNLFRVEADFTTDIAKLKGALDTIPVYGGTRIWESVIEAIKLLRVRSGRKALILVTDGKNRDGNQFRPIAVNDAVAAGIPVYSVGIGTDVDVAELTGIAAATGGRFFNSPGTDGLEAIFATIADELITDECVLTYRSDDTCSDGTMRLVDIELSANGLVAQDDTTYSAPNKRDPITFTVDMPVSVPSRNQVIVPVLPTIPLPSVTPVIYSMTVSYNNTLMQWMSYSLTGTISEGLPVSVSEATPGVLAITMPGGLPARLTGSLLDLTFDVFASGRDVLTGVKVMDGTFSTMCPWQVTTSGDTMRILACEESYTVGGGERLLVGSGLTVDVPLRLNPVPPAGDRLNLQARLTYDENLLTYSGITLAGGMLQGSVLVTPASGGIDVAVDGVVGLDVPVFASVSFIASRDKKPREAIVTVDAASFVSLCKVNAAYASVSVMIDGICEPLVRRTNAATLSNHPNPFGYTTTLTYAIPVEGMARVRLLDSQGREVKVLLEAWMAKGEYTHSFDASELPAGEYLAVLETSGSTMSVRRLLLMR